VAPTQELGGVALIERLNKLGGKHGVGRIDQIEDRLVGIKSREIYEAPAAVILHAAHKALEEMVLTKDALRFKSAVAREYAELIYNGLWFTAHHQDLARTRARSFVTARSASSRSRCARSSAAAQALAVPTALATYGKVISSTTRRRRIHHPVRHEPARAGANAGALGEGTAAMLDVPRKVLAAEAKPSRKKK
jgi:hypothetical protein